MIGILDSGVGGLSIYREIKKKFPETAVIYFADEGNFPYGEKTETELLDIVRAAAKTLIESGAKIIVLACNSATVATVSEIRKEFCVPIIGVEPAVKMAAANSKNGKIGVMATKITTKEHDGERLASNCELLPVHNSDLVSKIENDINSVTDDELKVAIKPFLDFGADSVVLGCTHYYFVVERLVKMYPDITFYAPAEAVAAHFTYVAHAQGIELTYGNDVFFCSAEATRFKKSLYDLLEIEDADIREI